MAEAAIPDTSDAIAAIAVAPVAASGLAALLASRKTRNRK